MRRLVSLAAAALIAAPLTSGAQAPLASAIEHAPDGVVRLQYAARQGVCGDGRDVVAMGEMLFMRDLTSYGHFKGVDCQPGPLRVSLTRSGGRTTRSVVQVGGSWRSTSEHVTDLGVVSSREAADYILSIVPQLEGGRQRERSLLPAVLAADFDALPPLLSLARSTSRTRDTRRQAIQWIGVLGDREQVPALASLVHADDSEDGIATSALGALAALRNDAGLPTLLGIARNTAESITLRKSALFWAGQSPTTKTSDIVEVYEGATNRDLREHAIFVLSDRHDEPSLQALLNIAKTDRDTRMRGRALFWLAERDDPRVTKLISDLIGK
ncbi:MAG: hypothetical protein JWO05_3659 [Gemmatimonadetes bacterium]|nr:hypothetical protein [Gemmatimonadota bacterium]